MYYLIADILKYALVLVVYMFIYSVIKLIYLDITDTRRMENSLVGAIAYLKTTTMGKNLKYKLFDSYGIRENSVVGSSKKCDVCIKDPYMSKENTSIFLKDGAFYIKDLDSTNGTYVNGRKLSATPRKLKDGDKIKMGDLDFVFVDPYDMA